ncbi:MAG TPA: PEP-CTERM sorting domain-containing protein [Casimicrobiaceae bacterium]
MNITFNGDTQGAAPSTTSTVTYPIVKPIAIGGYTATTSDSPPTAASGTILVQDIGGMNHAAVMTTNATDAELGALWLDTGFSVTSQTMFLSFDVDVIDAPTDATSQPKTLGAGTAGIFLGMNTYTSAGWAARFAIAPTSATGGVFAIRTPDNTGLQSFFNYTEGTTYHVSLLSDYGTGMVRTWVDNVDLGSLPFWTAGAANVSTSEFFFHLNGQQDHVNVLALDNIVGSTSVVPEPASLTLLLIGGVAMALGRRLRAKV